MNLGGRTCCSRTLWRTLRWIIPRINTSLVCFLSNHFCGNFLVCLRYAAITIAIQLRFDFDSASIWLRHSDKITIRLRFDFDSVSIWLQRKLNVFIFLPCRGIVANEKTVGGAYCDVIVYVMVIRTAFTLADQHPVAPCTLSMLVQPFHLLLTSLVLLLLSCL